ncbi:MAG: MaoC family dehydratase [Alphaproteobacteria bacterium]|nr:MaoC family dehydratase [Alphaproteobacteria bacterium]
MLHYEDYPVGLEIDLGSHHVTAEEIIDYAREFDPQPFHLSEAAGKQSILGGLAASGWQSSAILIRLAVTGMANKSAAMASNAMDEGRWIRPVFAGETLHGKGTVMARRVSAKRPEMGILTMRWELCNDKGEPKVEITGVQFIRVRNP